MLACSDRPLLDARLYLDAHPSPGLWLPNGCMASGGSGVRWFQRELAAGAALDVLDAEAAATPPGADGVVMLPYLLGEKTPVNDPLATGAFVGLRAGHGRGHVFRAVLESFAYGVRHHLEVLAEHGVRPTRARVTNGGASSRLWKQIVADVTGLVLEPVVDHPGSALGAAFAAGMGTGAFAGVERRRALRRARPTRSCRAPRSAAVYDERYRVYRALYGALKRQREREAGAAAGGVGDADRAAVQLDDRARDREPEAGTARGAALVAAPEALEDPLLRARAAVPRRCRSRSPRRRRARSISTRPPGGVWRMALPTRFESTRPSCSGSQRPRRPGGHSRSSATSAKRASAA